MGSKKINMVGGGERCPCGSGRLYRECCLKGEARYFRDESGKVVKFNIDCVPGVVVESGECGHDCERCERHGEQPLVLAVVTEEGGTHTHFDATEIGPTEIKHVIALIALVQSRVERALVVGAMAIGGGVVDESLRGQVVLLLLARRGEGGGDLEVGGAESFVGVPLEALESAVGGLARLQLEMTLALHHMGMLFGFHSIMGDDLEESDDDDD